MTDIRTRCVCGHLLYVHAEKETLGKADQRVTKGQCLNQTCSCREPRPLTPVYA